MKLKVDIKEKKQIPHFIHMVESLEYATIIKEVNDEGISQMVSDLADAFNDVKLHVQGKKKLKFAKQLLNEL